MKGLTLTQPWATLIAIGAKRIETRSWQTSYRGPIAIHAGQGLGPVGGSQGLAELVCSTPFCEVLTGAGYCGPHPRQPERGAIIAVAQLVEIAPITTDGIVTAAGRLYPESPEHDFGDYAPGRFAWLLANVRQLRTPVRCRGTLGLWPVPAVVAAQIEAQL